MQKIKYFALVLFTLANLSARSQAITENLALQLSRMPLSCIVQEWPNKTSHMSDATADHRLLPSELHPAFYGCLDWHSSVHGHWMLVKILKTYPAISNRDSIIQLLSASFTAEKMKNETDYFSKYTGSNSFERTYGWAWLLKLDEELYKWDNPLARQWHTNLQPLTAKIVVLWKDYLPKQTYPNRTGIHPNTAFGLSFALDWARTVNDTSFEALIIQKSKQFYASNTNMPASLEPDGSDFFSPSLEAADLMSRVYDRKTFTKWFKKYYSAKSLAHLMEPPVVSDRSDYQIVHLDGLAFSRAWCFKGIANHLLSQKKTAAVMREKASEFISASLPAISHDNYGGSHWLASFAIYALSVE